MTRARLSTRPGFTLVELLVVVGLILVLLGLTLAVSSSGITDSYKATNASDRVSGWLLIAKSKAQREKKPAGVRFVVGASNQIREAQYIEVPDPYAPLRDPTNAALPLSAKPRLIFLATVGQPTRVFVADCDTTDLKQSVFMGDMLSLPDFNLLVTIGFPPGGPAWTPGQVIPTTVTTLPGVVVGNVLEIPIRSPGVLPNFPPSALPVFPSPVPPATTYTASTTAFGFHRRAQPAIGEPTLQLTGDMVVDMTPGMSLASAVSGEFDVLFAANGEVMNAPSGKTVFWVRDARLPTPRAVGVDNRVDYEAAGQMALIVVYSKTGAIATQPVTLPTANGVVGHNPYSATTDAVNTGL